MVPLPSLPLISAQQRGEGRGDPKARAELKEQLNRETTLGAVLERAESDDVVGKLKCPPSSGDGASADRATQIMEKLRC